MDTPHTPHRATTAFAAVAQAADLCAARPLCPQTREVFRLVLRKLEAELGAPVVGPRLMVVR